MVLTCHKLRSMVEPCGTFKVVKGLGFYFFFGMFFCFSVWLAFPCVFHCFSFIFLTCPLFSVGFPWFSLFFHWFYFISSFFRCFPLVFLGFPCFFPLFCLHFPHFPLVFHLVFVSCLCSSIGFASFRYVFIGFIAFSSFLCAFLTLVFFHVFLLLVFSIGFLVLYCILLTVLLFLPWMCFIGFPVSLVVLHLPVYCGFFLHWFLFIVLTLFCCNLYGWC